MSNNVMNIVNFVRGYEPRRPKDLYTPVAQEIAVNRENDLKSTFLLQYDAMLRSDLIIEITQDNIFDGKYTKLVFRPLDTE